MNRLKSFLTSFPSSEGMPYSLPSSKLNTFYSFLFFFPLPLLISFLHLIIFIDWNPAFYVINFWSKMAVKNPSKPEVT